MATHADVTAQLDAVMLNLHINLTYLTTVVMTVVAVMVLRACSGALDAKGLYYWWLKPLAVIPLLVMPTLIGLLLLAFKGEARVLAAAPAMTGYLMMWALIALVVLGGLWDALKHSNRFNP